MAHPQRDVAIPADAPVTLLTEKHRNYLEHYGEDVDSYEFAISEYLRISGMYWTVTCLDLLDALKTSQRFNRDAVINYVKSCQKPSGGFGPHPTHDENLLHTLSAIQILCTYDALSEVDKDTVCGYVVSLQKDDGSFVGDKWGEVDLRFSMCGLACLALLGLLDRCDREKAVNYLQTCLNFDGGCGALPRAESHGAMIYCCVGSLSILNRLDIVDADKLGLWLAKRQLQSGGLNGRPEKLPDVCYSWWILASLAIIGRLEWIDKKKLINYILACQDIEVGGISDRPGDMADPFHTVFGTAGLSLLSDSIGDVNAAGEGNSIPVSSSLTSLKTVNPVFCMAQEIIDRLGIKVQILSYVNT